MVGVEKGEAGEGLQVDVAQPADEELGVLQEARDLGADLFHVLLAGGELLLALRTLGLGCLHGRSFLHDGGVGLGVPGKLKPEVYHLSRRIRPVSVAALEVLLGCTVQQHLHCDEHVLVQAIVNPPPQHVEQHLPLLSHTHDVPLPVAHLVKPPPCELLLQAVRADNVWVRRMQLHVTHLTIAARRHDATRRPVYMYVACSVVVLVFTHDGVF
mmetsp:Transcript_38249/g.109215  ORF Transcript_38249/g.109215 Transcript_38249/m.109215 type:complete len:213 (+) Transcript_38249:604-1242(+)